MKSRGMVHGFRLVSLYPGDWTNALHGRKEQEQEACETALDFLHHEPMPKHWVYHTEDESDHEISDNDEELEDSEDEKEEEEKVKVKEGPEGDGEGDGVDAEGDDLHMDTDVKLEEMKEEEMNELV